MNEPPITHDPAAHRFEVTVGGLKSMIDYQSAEGRMIVTHTYVPPELRGRGIAEKLARAALDHARAQGLRVTPQCSYVARFIGKNREYQPLVEGK